MNYKFILIIIIVLLIIYLKNKKINFSVSTFYELKGYNDLLKDQYTWNYTSGGIPKIIIKTGEFKRESMPDVIINILKNIQNNNKDYQLYYFDNNECLEFMKDYSEDVLKCYNKIKPGAYKADIFRICILEKYGGCYSDLGHETFFLFNDILEDYNMVLVKDAPLYKDTGIFNAFMCTFKNNNFFKMILHDICENIKNEYYGNHHLGVTGPILVGNVFLKYFNIISFKHIKSGTYILNNIKIKMLRNERSIIHIILTTSKIKENNNELINTKFKNYYKIMYKNKKKYTDLWNERNIYN